MVFLSVLRLCHVMVDHLIQVLDKTKRCRYQTSFLSHHLQSLRHFQQTLLYADYYLRPYFYFEADIHLVEDYQISLQSVKSGFHVKKFLLQSALLLDAACFPTNRIYQLVDSRNHQILRGCAARTIRSSSYDQLSQLRQGAAPD